MRRIFGNRNGRTRSLASNNDVTPVRLSKSAQIENLCQALETERRERQRDRHDGLQMIHQLQVQLNHNQRQVPPSSTLITIDDTRESNAGNRQGNHGHNRFIVEDTPEIDYNDSASNVARSEPGTRYGLREPGRGNREEPMQEYDRNVIETGGEYNPGFSRRERRHNRIHDISSMGFNGNGNPTTQQTNLTPSDLMALARTIGQSSSGTTYTGTQSLIVYNGRPEENLEDWIFTMERYFRNNGIINDYKQADIAFDFLRGNARSQYMSILDGQDITWAYLRNSLISNFQPINNQRHLRKQLSQLKQNESVRSFIYQFDAILNQIRGMQEIDIIERFLEGLQPSIARTVNLREPHTLAEAKHAALLAEETYQTFKTTQYVHTRNETTKNHHQTASKDDELKPSRIKQSTQFKEARQKGLCFKCGENWVKNHRCNETPTTDNTKRDISNRRQPHISYNVITQSSIHNLLKIGGQIKGSHVTCVIDTGASTSILSEQTAKRLNIQYDGQEVPITTANGSKTYGRQTDRVPIVIKQRYCELEFVVLPNKDFDILLGVDWLKRFEVTINVAKGTIQFASETILAATDTDEEQYSFLALDENLPDLEDDDYWEEIHNVEDVGTINEELNPQQKQIVVDFVKSHENCVAKTYNNLGCCTVQEHVIQVHQTKPIYIPPYRKAHRERDMIKLEVEKMLKASIIRESRSPWSFPVVMASKKDGSKRFCVDYRKLNAITDQDCFPMPRIDDILERVVGSRWFSAIDLKSGYWQMRLSPESIAKTAFSTPDGHYEFLRLPFGLKNAPAEFSRMMQFIFGDLKFIEIYIDDVTVHSESFDQHLKHLEIVFQRLEEANLKMNLTKCKWFMSSVKILGHIVEQNKIKMDTSKIDAVQQLPYCKTVKHVQSFLGLCGYYRRFVRDFAKIAQPLNNLLKKDVVWNFDDDCKEAFDTLRNRLVEYPILRKPEFQRKFYLFTDASGFALGAILSQKDEDNKEYVCCYASRLLKGAENHYGITEKECLAVVWAIKQFRTYLYGTKFEIITDHAALCWLMTINEPTGRLARWAIQLQAFEFSITHRKGKIHNNVDALSRPIMIAAETNSASDEFDANEKTLDPYDDEKLLHFIKQGRHPRQ
jgi:hypothetical protein